MTQDLPGHYRIGAISRLASVPVSTLRVWEQRYGAFEPSKSAGRHRLYTEADLVRARLLRQLTESGHAIGGIATLHADRLQSMLSTARAVAAPAARSAISAPSALVVGEALAARINSAAWKHRWHETTLDVRRLLVDLADLERLAEDADDGARPAADLLLVRVNTMPPDVPLRLERASRALGIERVIVLYVFGAQSTVAAARAAGMLVGREPVGDADLAQLLDAILLVDAAGRMRSAGAGAAIPARRYSDAALARVAQSPSSIVCECPRHLADLIVQLAAFEEYSEQCLHRNEEDAQLHAYFRSISGSARALFEQALAMAAEHGGIELEIGAG